jgi:uncharacterized protein (DUF2126 family)
MSTRVALHHRTRYQYDRPVAIGPHEIRLRPTPHCRTPILSYALSVRPGGHTLHWQHDPLGNHVARLLFPEPSSELAFTVDLVADVTVINPFDFFVAPEAVRFPFIYSPSLQAALAPYLVADPAGPALSDWLGQCRAELVQSAQDTVAFLVDLNRRVQGDIAYLVRMAPGVQTPDETLRFRSGSCRDSGWLLVQVLRHLGLAARFVSGYLIQLAPDAEGAGGTPGAFVDSVDLHAWAEVFVPGAGWLGLDPTSGFLAGEGHVPLACGITAADAAPVIGNTAPCVSTLEFDSTLTRLQDAPRTREPYGEAGWRAVDALGQAVDRELQANDVRLTHGGEPTFVAADDLDGAEWNHQALSPRKWELAQSLAWRLRERFAPAGLLHYGQGKWYPGERAPRWALGVHWRRDGQPVWRDVSLIARDADDAPPLDTARLLASAVANRLGLDPAAVIEAHEDPLAALSQESVLPENVDPTDVARASTLERAHLARLLSQGLGDPVAFILPLRARAAVTGSDVLWETSRWPLRRDLLYLVPGDAPAGARLPLVSLPEVAPDDFDPDFDRDPFDPRTELHESHERAERKRHARLADRPQPREIVRTALCCEIREGCLRAFLPPLTHAEGFLALVAAIEAAAAECGTPVRLEGYGPPPDPRLVGLQITPDPGVIEVNVQPSASWNELTGITRTVYDEAQHTGLTAWKYLHDGRHTGTGGGSHLTLGGPTAADSPFLRRPDLLASLITYWQHHPALSYLFSGQFIGATSQAPRVDEAREDNLHELEIALEQLAAECPAGAESHRPWLVDRLLRNFLIDITGNTHRSEFCIDKLYSPDSPTGRLGLVELRAIEMPPHPQMSLAVALLLRTLVARFWKSPYRGRLVRWGTQLHDRWMLPHFVERDIRDVMGDLRRAGFAYQDAWLAPFVELRFPRFGAVTHDGIEIEVRHALEPWNVLGEEVGQSGTSRYVDSSVERVQVKVRGMTADRHVVVCNGRMVPLHPTGVHGEFVAGVRFKARNPASSRHPTIAPHPPLVFDAVDTWSGRSLGGCTFHGTPRGENSTERRPVDASEADARRAARFSSHGHAPGAMDVRPEPPDHEFPYTLDLRRTADQRPA